MSKTCTACRGRKMRCDGAVPLCGPCSRARKPMDCIYLSVNTPSPGPKATLLQKGAACLACRRKKKKCNAQRPACNTCISAGKVSECEYDEDRQDLVLAQAEHIQNLQARFDLIQEQLLVTQHQLAQALAPSAPFYPNMCPQPDGYSNYPVQYPGSPGPSSLYTMPQAVATLMTTPPMAPYNMNDAMYPNDALLRILLPNRPVYAQDNFPRLLTSTFELRSTFLTHSIQIGVYLRETKLKAIKEGDQSGEIVHPTIVYLAQLIGGCLWKLHGKTYRDSNVIDPDFELSNALDALNNIPDPVTLVFINCLFAWYYLFKQNLPVGQQWLFKAYRAVEDNDLQLTPPAGNAVVTSSAEPSEDTKELITALSQLLFLDKAGAIVLSLPSITSDKFDQDVQALPQMQPWMLRNNVITMRARSVYFLHQALRLSRMRTDAAYETSSCTSNYEVLSSDWYKQYWNTLEDATEHIAILEPQMLKATINTDPDPRQGVSIKVCMIIGMAAKLELHRHPAPQHADSRKKMLDIVLEIVRLTKDFKDEDFMMLDPVLGTCWQVVAAALWQERHTFLQLAQTEPPGHWRDVFNVMIQCATKMGSSWPFMDKALESLREIANIVTPTVLPPQTMNSGLEVAQGDYI